MSGARPIKMPYTPDQVMCAGFSDSTNGGINNPPQPAVLRRIILSIAILAAAFVYINTMHPAFSGNDSPETAAVSYFLGIGHPPGYPLFSMCAKIMTLLPAGNIAFRVNLFSVILALMTLLLTYKITGLTAAYFINDRNKKIVQWLRIFTVLCAAFSGIFWNQAIEAKGAVYMLNLLFFSALIYIFLRLLERFHIKYVYMAAFIFGLSAANHWQSTLIPAPLGIFFAVYYYKRFRLKRILFTALFIFSGIAAYLYLPVRAFNAPVFNWGDPVSFGAVLRIIFRLDYASGFVPSPGLYFDQLKEAAKIIALNYSFITVFAAAGIAAMFKRAKKQAAMLCIAALLNVVLVVFFAPAGKDIIYLQDIFLMPGLYILALFIMPGFLALYGLRMPLKVLIPAALVLFAVMCAAGYRNNNSSRDFIAYDYGSNILLSMGPGAVYMADGDYNAMPVYYLLEVENKRPDIKFLNASFLIYQWGIDAFRSRTGINSAMTPLHRDDNLRSVVHYGVDKGGVYRNYFWQEPFKMNDPGFFENDYGLLVKYAGAKAGSAAWLFKLYSYRGIFDGERIKPPVDTSIITWYPVTMVDTAASLMNSGDYAGSIELNREALGFPVEEPADNINYNISLAYFKLDDKISELHYLEKCVRLKTKITAAYERLGVLYYNMGLLDRALDVFYSAKAAGSKAVYVQKGIDVITGFSEKERLELALMKGNEMLIKNDYISACEIFDFLIEKGYKNDIINKNIGVFHFKTGNFESALNDFRKSENETHDAGTERYIVMTYIKLGKFSDAQTEAGYALNLFPGDKVLAELISEIKEHYFNGKDTNSVNGQGRGDKDKQSP
jgi:tetratricopeptide (TPR) repeat protein